MALIKCSECGKEISDKAEACPHCGCPMSAIVETKVETIEKTKDNIKNNANIKKKGKIKWLLIIVGAIIILTIAISVIISSIPSKYAWDEIILKSSLPQPKSEYGRLYTNDADDLYLSVERMSYAEYEEYVDGCVEKGFTYVTESEPSSYTAFNSDGYELELDYHEYNESLDIHLDVRIAGKIKWSNSELASLLPIPKSNIGSIVNDYTYGYEVYIGDTSKTAFNDYISECELKGFNLEMQKQDNSFFAKNELGYELTIEYYECDIIYIDLNVPEETASEDSSDEESETENSTVDEETKTDNNDDPEEKDTDSSVKDNSSVYDNAVDMCQILKDALYNPDSLQIHKVLYIEQYGTEYYYLDYSAMNKMGGYTRNEYYAKFENSSIKYMVNEDDTGYPDCVEYDIMVEKFEELPYETLDLNMIEPYLD